MKHIIRSTAGALVVGMIAAGCSTTPPANEVAAANTALGNAGQAVDRAAADPHVAKFTPSELDRATDSLQKAQAAWKDKHDLATTTQLAYLAQQRAATAQELAAARASDEALVVAAANRDQVMSTLAERRSQQAAPTASTAPTEPGQQGVAGFATGRSKLPPNSMAAIGQLATAIKNNPGSKVVIEGHTDNVGSAKRNQTLAMERAQAVRSALVQQGVEVGRITVQSQGEQNPVASNDTGMGRYQNRRAQVIIGEAGASMVGSSQGATPATSSGSGEQSGKTGQTGQPTQSAQGEQSGQNGQSEQQRQ
jgi:outer membrane protein OmpA-like peptidoglycan-associated protein